MPKRRRDRDGDKNRNPLSSARKESSGRKGGNDGGRSKADRDARSLWHRKSGAGYRLFLSFYGSQPIGVIASDDDPVEDAVGEDDAVVRANNGIGGGMSRAARRRRRRGGSGSGSSRGGEANEIVGESSLRRDRRATSDGVEECRARRSTTDSSSSRQHQHPLLRAFADTNGRYPHLTGFVRALSRPLPLTLRFRECEVGGRSSPSPSPSCFSAAADDLKRRLDANHRDLVEPASFDATRTIYQSTPNSSLCRSNLGELSPKLKELIVDGSSSGILARQELGSILPVAALRAVGAMRAGSKVLDLCASPGSKTLQALEIVARRAECGTDGSGSRSGRVIANDVHPGRLDSLREAIIRSGVPGSLTSRVTYTNYDASAFPPPRSGRLFDAIVCDVPCGGDGTVRKDAHVLPMWTPNIGNAMHGLQLRILLRALGLVKVGGVVCYSTCSMNPIEDEAVVAAALVGNGIGGANFQLLDWPSGLFPGLVRRPGVFDWRVAFYDPGQDEDGDNDIGSLMFFDDYESASAAGAGGDISPSFWSNVVENRNLGLHRCTRLFPQDQDSGGFFLGLIKRLS